MSKNARKNKKFNPKKAFRTSSLFALRNHYLACVCNVQGLNTAATLINKKGDKVKLPDYLMESMKNNPFNWSILLAVLSTDNEGRKVAKSSEIICHNKLYHSELTQLINDEHKKLVTDNDLCAIGWIASPNGYLFEPEEAVVIFDKLKAWSSNNADN